MPIRRLLLFFAVWVAAAQAQVNVWVADDLTRVRPQQEAQGATTAIVKAARNEYAPFQIIVRAGAQGLKQVNAAAGDLAGEAGAAIPARHVALYREHYIEVKTPSPKSKEGPGWYPDALIPFSAGAEGQPRFAGAPFDLEPGRNQPIWVDLFVPKDAAAGEYGGTITVTAAGQAAARVGIKLTVWDFALPDTPSMRSNFGSLSSRVANFYKISAGSAQFQALERQFAETLAAHRLSPPIPSWLRPRVNADGTIDASGTDDGLKDYIERYHVTGFPISLVGSDPLNKDRPRNVTYLQSIYEYLRARAWEQRAYIYVLDEPNTAEAYEEVRQRARLIHEAQPGIKVLCTEQPTPQKPEWGTLVGSVDVWVPLWYLFEEPAGQERLRAGEELWSYTALCQGPRGGDTPFWQLDFPLLNYRLPAWMSWRLGMTGLLYWTTAYWDPAIDLWTNPLSYRNQYNCEGVLLYPGADLAVPGLVTSMRLKEVREGMEDYEYIRMLAARGQKEEADRLVRKIARTFTDWNSDPIDLYQVREEIAKRILAAASPAPPRPQPPRRRNAANSKPSVSLSLIRE
jgi:hypothetical protein